MYEIKIEGMTCDGCVSSVKSSVLAKDPAAQIQIDLKKGTASVESKIPLIDITIAIEDAGFDVVN